MTDGSVTSQDGTTIAFDKIGSGPPVILVASALSDRSDTRRLAQLLAERFTVINYDRRGRGASGDTAPYAVDREIEDIAALIEHAGGSAFVFGSSSGAALGLAAAANDIGIEKLAMFEPPYVVHSHDPRPPDDFASRLNDLIAADRRSDAVRYFMTKAIKMPGIAVTMMRLVPPLWSKLKAMAHTLPYDAAIMAGTQTGRPLECAQWLQAKATTLVIYGGKSPAWMERTAHAVADALPNATHRRLEGVSHSAVVMAPKKVAPTLVEFFMR